MLRSGRRLVYDDEAIRDCIHDLFLKLHGYRASLRVFDSTQNPDPVKFYLLSSLKNGLVTRQGQQERAERRARKPFEANRRDTRGEAEESKGQPKA